MLDTFFAGLGLGRAGGASFFLSSALSANFPLITGPLEPPGIGIGAAAIGGIGGGGAIGDIAAARGARDVCGAIACCAFQPAGTSTGCMTWRCLPPGFATSARST